MAGTKSRTPSVSRVLDWLKLGYGQGEGKHYKPWVHVRDVPSDAMGSMVHSRTTGRVHHYLSGLEFFMHLLAEYSSRILDIREQYALLPWEETQSIAQQVGLRHPVIPRTTTPAVMTTDLLLSLREPDGVRVLAISVKPTPRLSPRALEKLLIERIYWNRRGISWFLATEESIPMVRARNLCFFENSIRHDDIKASGLSPQHFARSFEGYWAADKTYNKILSAACAECGVDTTEGHRLLGAAVWKRQSKMDIDTRILEHTSTTTLRT